MNLNIRKGTMKDVDQISDLYDTVNDFLAVNINYPGWMKGVYPTTDDAIQGVHNNDLFIASIDSQIVGTIRLSHKPEEAYATVKWKQELSNDLILVIYTFAVHPAFSKQGIASTLLAFAEGYAKEQGVHALRLDVVEGNIPAIKLYEKHDFAYIATIDLGLEQYGLKWFRTYEKILGESMKM